MRFLISIGLLFSVFNCFGLVVETIYGKTDVTEPVLIELFESKAFNRLHLIHQYGVAPYFHTTVYPYSRYDHSVGVFYLVRMYGGSLQEQIVSLLHDVSHTVFSHVGDHVADYLKKRIFDQNKEAYQDMVHVSYLQKTDIASILKAHSYALEDMDHKNGHYLMLEQDLPAMCADRLEYTLYGAYIEGWMSQGDIKTMLSSIRYQDGFWFFIDKDQALQFAEYLLRLTREIFASDWNIGSYEYAAKALLRAIKLGTLQEDDIYFGTDDVVWNVLINHSDTIIQEAVKKIMQAKNLYEPGTLHDHDLAFKGKFRGIDPLVMTEKGLMPLTSLDSEFSKKYEHEKMQISKIRYYKERP